MNHASPALGIPLMGPDPSLLGVYSGRLTDNENEDISEIGVVWKESALKEITEGGVPGFRVEDMSSMNIGD